MSKSDRQSYYHKTALAGVALHQHNFFESDCLLIFGIYLVKFGF